MKAHLGGITWNQTRPTLIGFKFYVFQNAYRLDGLIQLRQRICQYLAHKRKRAAIKDGHFGAVNFNPCVMHTAACQSREQMLDG